jgi:hypothetical protein
MNAHVDPPRRDDGDEEYQAAVEQAIFCAILDASKRPDRTCLVTVAPVVQAMLNTLALLMAAGPATNTPQRTREFCEELGKRLRKRIVAMKAERAAGSLSFVHFRDPDNGASL